MYDILSGYLENGMRVVLHKIHGLKTIALGIWVKQGSKHEDDSNNGISHILEHMSICRNNNNEKLNKLMNQIINNGIQYNASTTKESTSYYFKGLSENLDLCLDVLYNIVANNNSFEEEILENEKKVVEREAVSFYSSFNQIKERTSQALFGNLDVGRIIVGNLDVIKKANIRQLENIRKKTYTPVLMIYLKYMRNIRIH